MLKSFKKSIIMSVLVCSLLSEVKNNASMLNASTYLEDDSKDNNYYDEINKFLQKYKYSAGINKAIAEMIKDEVDKQIELQRQVEEKRRKKEIKRQEKIEQVRIAEEKRQHKYDKFLKIYSEYFHLNSEKVIKLARMLTKDYTVPIEEVTKVISYNTDSIEAACMVFVCEINKEKLPYMLENSTCSKNDFVCNNSIETINDDLTLNNGLSYSQFLGTVADLLQVNKNYALAISYLESGRVTSDMARTRNNFAGIGGPGNVQIYPSPEAGIISFCHMLKIYETYNFQNIMELSGEYVNGDRTKPVPSWAADVTSIYREACNNSDNLFLSDKQNNEKTYKLKK